MTLIEAMPMATGVCLGVGALAKTWPSFPNAYIPTLVAAVGALLVPSLAGWNATNVIFGLQAGLAATGIHSGTRDVVGDVRRRTGHTEILKKP